VGYVISGRLKVVMDGERELELGPGDAYEICPGHDAWVIGKEPFVALELKNAAKYAKPSE
jgi:mannose-6-phosphate isomerase-like protein (cupin superfamily)